MTDNQGASAKADQALVSDQAATRLDPTGFDPSRERGGEFSGRPTASLAAQCRLQARESLDPEYERFMFAVADRLQGFAASKSQGAPSTDWQLAYAIEWANRSVESVKEVMWRYEDALRFYAEPSTWTDGDVPCHVYAIDDAGYTARQALQLPNSGKPARDSDRNPKGGDGTAPSRSDESASRDSGIAQPLSPEPSHDH